MSNTPTHDWFVQAFGPLYSVIYAHRTVESARKEVAFARQCVDLTPKDTVLDLCCGNARHMVHLLSSGASVTGLDYSTELLCHARANLAEFVPELNPRLVRADMRRIPFQDAFSVVVNFFTSFGYFMTDEENLSVVAGVTRILKPQGRFYIDYLNADQVAQTLVPESTRQHDEYVIHEKRWIDPNPHRVNKSTTVERDGEVVGSTSESVRLYTLDDLTGMLKGHGLHIEQVYGNHDGDAFSTEQPRMILVGKKN